MKYSIFKADQKYIVVEMGTMYVLGMYDKKVRAQKMKDKLNSGYAFAGNTPGFFAKGELQHVV